MPTAASPAKRALIDLLVWHVYQLSTTLFLSCHRCLLLDPFETDTSNAYLRELLAPLEQPPPFTKLRDFLNSDLTKPLVCLDPDYIKATAEDTEPPATKLLIPLAAVSLPPSSCSCSLQPHVRLVRRCHAHVCRPAMAYLILNLMISTMHGASRCTNVLVKEPCIRKLLCGLGSCCCQLVAAHCG